MAANADVVRSFWEAFGRRDLDGAMAHADDDAEIVVPETVHDPSEFATGVRSSARGGRREAPAELSCDGIATPVALGHAGPETTPLIPSLRRLAGGVRLVLRRGRGPSGSFPTPELPLDSDLPSVGPGSGGPH